MVKANNLMIKNVFREVEEIGEAAIIGDDGFD